MPDGFQNSFHKDVFWYELFINAIASLYHASLTLNIFHWSLTEQFSNGIILARLLKIISSVMYDF